jgi:hypothetical protein
MAQSAQQDSGNTKETTMAHRAQRGMGFLLRRHPPPNA